MIAKIDAKMEKRVTLAAMYAIQGSYMLTVSTLEGILISEINSQVFDHDVRSYTLLQAI